MKNAETTETLEVLGVQKSGTAHAMNELGRWQSRIVRLNATDRGCTSILAILGKLIRYPAQSEADLDCPH